MPHGGGHVGGGGGFSGGGFHGGGGGYHHHHHHHSSTVFVGPPIVWWGYGWRSPYYWEGRAWGRIFLAFIVVIIVILVIAVLAARYDNNSGSPSYLSPGDTRIIGPSSTFCESTTLNNRATTVNATMYRLQNKPSLTLKNSFAVTDQFLLSDGIHQYWSFYLYPGSSYALTTCLTIGSAKFYVIKGKSNYDSWVSSPYSSYANYFLYGNLCGSINKTASQTFTAEDEYYFVFYNDLGTLANVKMTLTFNRMEYVVQSSNVVESCAAWPASSCSLTVPYNSDYWYMVETSPPYDGSWDANIDVSTSCDRRVWVYVVIVLVPLAGVIAILGAVIGVCCIIKKVSTYQSLPSTTIQNQPSAPAVPDAPKLYDQPPPYVGGTAPPPPYQ